MPEPSAWCENEIFPDGGDYYADLTNISDSDGDHLYIVALGAMDAFSVDFGLAGQQWPPTDLVKELEQDVRVIYRIPLCDHECCVRQGSWADETEYDFLCSAPIPYGYLPASRIQYVMEAWATRLINAEFFEAFLANVRGNNNGGKTDA